MTHSTTLTHATSLPAVDQTRRITYRTRGRGMDRSCG